MSAGKLTSKDFDSESLSYFPLLVEEAVSKLQYKVLSPECIPSGVEVKILEINYVEGAINVTSVKEKESSISEQKV
jgi:hypothetical protein